MIISSLHAKDFQEINAAFAKSSRNISEQRAIDTIAKGIFKSVSGARIIRS